MCEWCQGEVTGREVRGEWGRSGSPLPPPHPDLIAAARGRWCWQRRPSAAAATGSGSRWRRRPLTAAADGGGSRWPQQQQQSAAAAAAAGGGWARLRAPPHQGEVLEVVALVEDARVAVEAALEEALGVQHVEQRLRVVARARRHHITASGSGSGSGRGVNREADRGGAKRQRMERPEAERKSVQEGGAERGACAGRGSGLGWCGRTFRSARQPPRGTSPPWGACSPRTWPCPTSSAESCGGRDNGGRGAVRRVGAGNGVHGSPCP